MTHIFYTDGLIWIRPEVWWGWWVRAVQGLYHDMLFITPLLPVPLYIHRQAKCHCTCSAKVYSTVCPFTGDLLRCNVIASHSKEDTLWWLTGGGNQVHPVWILNTLHQETFMMTESQSEQSGPREPPILLPEVIKCPTVVSGSEEVSHHWHGGEEAAMEFCFMEAMQWLALHYSSELFLKVPL